MNTGKVFRPGKSIEITIVGATADRRAPAASLSPWVQAKPADRGAVDAGK